MTLNSHKSKSIIAFMIVCFAGFDIASATTANIEKAIEHYHNADFDKAKSFFEKSLNQKGNMKNRQIAVTYLALIEMANGNMKNAERHLSDLLKSDPHLTLDKMGNLSPRLQDYTSHPDFQKLFNEVKSKDFAKPSGKIVGIGKKYQSGEKIGYSVSASDDRALKKLSFLVNGSSVKKEWKTGGAKAVFKSSFSTAKWKPGVYAYTFQIVDQSGKSAEYHGRFTLTDPVDRIRPTGTVAEIKDGYLIGETISFSVSGSDNVKIKKMTFLVNGSPVRQWDVGKKRFSEKSSFQTATWDTGRYEYALVVEDTNKNKGKYTGSFVLRSEKHEKILQSLSSNISKYNMLKDKEKRGEDVSSAIIPVIINAIENLNMILASYEDFSLSNSEMREKAERANSLLAMFEKELGIYKKHLSEMIEDLKE